MGRVSPPLTIRHEDRILLEQMLTGDEEQRIRAAIVLACSEQKQNKVIAKELNVAEITVSKWKNAYRDHGIEGIRVQHAGGRPTKYADKGDIPTLIKQCIESHQEWGAEEIAGALGIPTSKIYYELEKMGINFQRSRSWIYRTKVEPVAKWEPKLIMLYRSYGCGAIVSLTSSKKLGSKWEGLLETRNRSLIEALERSVVPVTLQGLLPAAINRANTSPSSRNKAASEYVTNVIEAWCSYVESSEITFHIFSFGCDAYDKGSKTHSCIYHTFETDDEMTSAFTHWMGSSCTGKQLIAVEELMQELKSYGTSLKEGTPVFAWSLQKPCSDPVSSQEEPLPDNPAGTDDEMSESTQEEINLPQALQFLSPDEKKELLEVLSSKSRESSGTGTKAGALLYMTDEDGATHFTLVQSDLPFQAMKEFDFHTKEGFVRDLSRLEEASLSFGQSLANASEQMYLNNSKKNES